MFKSFITLMQFIKSIILPRFFSLTNKVNHPSAGQSGIGSRGTYLVRSVRSVSTSASGFSPALLDGPLFGAQISLYVMYCTWSSYLQYFVRHVLAVSS